MLSEFLVSGGRMELPAGSQLPHGGSVFRELPVQPSALHRPVPKANWWLLPPYPPRIFRGLDDI